jgi:hypothetical protein
VFIYILAKIIDIKNTIRVGFNKKSPNGSDFNLYSPDSKRKKKYLKERAEEMRKKVLLQQKSVVNCEIDSKKNSLSSKRNITKNIYIEPRQNLDLETQYNRIKNELEAYNIQEKKFKA